MRITSEEQLAEMIEKGFRGKRDLDVAGAMTRFDGGNPSPMTLYGRIRRARRSKRWQLGDAIRVIRALGGRIEVDI